MARELSVGGLTTISTVDYPDHLAAVVFTQGCPWRCVYCHNQHLQSVVSQGRQKQLRWSDVLDFLQTRIGLIEAVVFSGGEPLLQDALLNAIIDVKKMGFLVGLHTGGGNSWNLQKVISHVDWIGLDLKTSFADYESITNIMGSGEEARRSFEIAIAADVVLEARMTMDSSIDVATALSAFEEVARMGVKTAVLQKCRDKNHIIVENPIFSDRLIFEDISKRFDNFFIR